MRLVCRSELVLQKVPGRIARRQAAVIPPKKNRKDQRPYDKDLYKLRSLIDHAFLMLKERWGHRLTIHQKRHIRPRRHPDQMLARWLNIS